MKQIRTALFTIAAAVTTACCTQAPEPYGAIPTPAQVEWQKMETNMFVHFGPNTFSGKEWGDGTESEDSFAPTSLDCRQWVATAKAAGMKGVIITAKHHDGFCLWPNPVSTHTVAQSKWMDGKGDILRDLSEACREYGLKFGVYVSPWDRNDPHYGTPEYNNVFVKTLESALGNYGEVFEQWFDGACGEGPNGKRQEYDWTLFNSTVWKMQPDAIIFSNVGPGCRWMGNESGSAGRTCWSTLDIEGYTPSISPDLDTLNCGNAYGQAWVPAETDVSIRPGWFWRESENNKVKSLDRLLKIYFESVGRNSLLLLNVPPDTRGLIHENDVARLKEFREALDKIFADNLAKGASAVADNSRGRGFSPANITDGDYDTYWAAEDGVTSVSFTVELPQTKTFNRVCLQEYIPLGQRISSFDIEIRDTEGNWKTIARETTVGYKRIVLTPVVTTSTIRVNIRSAHACPTISEMSLYLDTIYSDPDADAKNLEFTVHKIGESIVAELPEVRTVKGFTYIPAAKGEGGVITRYDIETSSDGENWTKVISNWMFDNIVNNPVAQEVTFDTPANAKYIRITALETSNCETYSCAIFRADE